MADQAEQHAELVAVPYRDALRYIRRAIDSIYEAEDGMPMCCAENARIYLLDAQEQIEERLTEKLARIDGDVCG